MMKTPFSARRLSYIALGAALIAVCAWISIPAPVPFTLQTFAVFAAVCILGGRDAALAVLVYLLIGGIGVPVFAGFKGGPGVLFGATGGYLWGFLAVALIYMLFSPKDSLPRQIAALSLGLAACYLFGTAWFIAVYSRTSEITVLRALSLCVVPFILPDLAKMALGAAVGRRVRRALKLTGR